MGGNPHIYNEMVAPGLSLNELFDAANECAHGNLPFDTDLDCGCWNLSRKKPRVVELKPLEPTTCECGCGEAVRPGRRFRPGHNARGHMREARRAA